MSIPIGGRRGHCILGRAFNTLSPISDVCDNIEYFFCIIQMIQLWHYWEIACSISINKIFFFIVIINTSNGGWGEVMKKISPFIQCSMADDSRLLHLCPKVRDRVATNYPAATGNIWQSKFWHFTTYYTVHITIGNGTVKSFCITW